MENFGSFKFKKSLIFSLILSFVMVVSAFCVNLIPSTQKNLLVAGADGIEITSDESQSDIAISEKWEDVSSTPLEILENSYVIADAYALAQFAKNVNAGNPYNGYTVYLTADIDLSGR